MIPVSMVDGLDGAPGVYTADWAETPNGRDFVMAMTKTHDLARRAQRPSPTHAHGFAATLVWHGRMDTMRSLPAKSKGSWFGQCAVRIGHGYDPMFQPLGHTVTFAEMSHDAKNEISHRADAFRKLIDGCFG